MNHEPTEEELQMAYAIENFVPVEIIAKALTAANRIRDRRVRAEALEEAMKAVYALRELGANPHSRSEVALVEAIEAIRALKDKEV